MVISSFFVRRGLFARAGALGLALTAGSAALQSAGAQLTLADALRQADRSAYGNRIASAETAQRGAQSIAPLKGILPTARLEGGYVRTTDPIGVFGSTLRQRAITQANFDPQRLNYPDALGNHQGSAVLEQPLVNADAWIARRSALHAASASRASQEWTRLSTRVDVIRGYYGVVLAGERVLALRAASLAAKAHVAQAEALVRQGLATKSDALLASVRAGEIESELAEAEGAESSARRGLAVLLGQTGEASVTLSTTSALPSGDLIRSVVSGDTASVAEAGRADVEAALRGLDAARADAKRAKSLMLPRINSFARYDWYSADRPFAGDRNWTIGIMATWTPFTNPSDISDMRAAGARGNAARAQADAARANARLELEQTQTALQVALARLTIAERAVAQSAEAHRIVARKYEGGLAGVAELLDAQAVATQSTLGFSHARWAAIVAAAERLRALGKDPGSLDALDKQDSRPTSPRN